MGTPSERDRLSRSACIPRLDFQTVRWPGPSSSNGSPSQAATAARGFQRGAGVGLGGEFVLEDSVGLREPLIHVAALQRDWLAAHKVAAVVDAGRAGVHRLHGVGDERQRLVGDVDQPQRVAGGVLVLGGDGGHLVAHEARLGVQDGQVRGLRGPPARRTGSARRGRRGARRRVRRRRRGCARGGRGCAVWRRGSCRAGGRRRCRRPVR